MGHIDSVPCGISVGNELDDKGSFGRREVMSIPCETELLLRIKENASLQAELSTALSEKSAYREVLEDIKDFLDHGAADYAHEVVKKALDRGPEEVLSKEEQEKRPRDRKPEVPVTREEVADAIMDSGDLAVLKVAAHLLKTFRVERR